MSVVNGVPVVLPPPKGYVVDFDNPQRQSVVATYWVVGVGNALAFFFMVQRLYVKVFVRKAFRLDDVCLITAWMFTLTIQILIARGFALGYIGVHAWEIPIDKFMEFTLYSVYLNPIIYSPPQALAKLVLLLFYLQLGNSSQWFKWSVYFAILVNVGSNVGIFFSSIFACDPIAMGWDITITDGTCINRPALFQATAALGVVTDVLIILIPFPMVFNLQMSRAKKAALLFTFAVGSATVVTSIIRLVLLIQSLSATDTTWGAGPISMWICIEANLLIMCASLPTLRLFFRTIAPTLFSSSERSHGYSYGPNGKNSGNGLSANRPNPRRQNYTGFDNDSRGDPNAPYQMHTIVTGGKQTPQRSEDDSSDRAIFQTKSTQVTYTEH